MANIMDMSQADMRKEARAVVNNMLQEKNGETLDDVYGKITVADTHNGMIAKKTRAAVEFAADENGASIAFPTYEEAVRHQLETVLLGEVVKDMEAARDEVAAAHPELAGEALAVKIGQSLQGKLIENEKFGSAFGFANDLAQEAARQDPRTKTVPAEIKIDQVIGDVSNPNSITGWLAENVPAQRARAAAPAPESKPEPKAAPAADAAAAPDASAKAPAPDTVADSKAISGSAASETAVGGSGDDTIATEAPEATLVTDDEKTGESAAADATGTKPSPATNRPGNAPGEEEPMGLWDTIVEAFAPLIEMFQNFMDNFRSGNDNAQDNEPATTTTPDVKPIVPDATTQVPETQRTSEHDVDGTEPVAPSPVPNVSTDTVALAGGR